MAPTARLGTGRSAEFADNGGGGAILISQEAENATGTPTTNAATTYALIPATLISFTLSGAQTVFFDGFATAGSAGSGFNTQLGLRIDGVDYNGPVVHGNQNDRAGLALSKAISLAAGAHTAQLVLRQEVAGIDAEILNSATKPTRLTALYTTPQVAGDGVVEGARVTKSTSTVLAASTPTVLTWDTVLNNSNGVYSGGSPTRLTAITGGWYALAASISWNTLSFTTTTWSLKARKNGSTIVGQDLFFSGGAFVVAIFPEQNKVNELVYLNAGDYIELIAETTEPSNRNTIVSSSQYSPIFSLGLIQTAAVASGGTGILASAVFTSGNYGVPSGAMTDVPDGAGFVEIAYVVTVAGLYFFDVDLVAYISTTFPSDSGMDVGCSVNTVDQGFVYPGPYIYVVGSTAHIRTPSHYRMPLSLGLGVNTIRLRANSTGGIPSATIAKVAASPVVITLIKG
jgi:hypothetical protein